MALEPRWILQFGVRLAQKTVHHYRNACRVPSTGREYGQHTPQESTVGRNLGLEDPPWGIYVQVFANPM